MKPKKFRVGRLEFYSLIDPSHGGSHIQIQKYGLIKKGS